MTGKQSKQVWVSPNPDGGWRVHRSESKKDSAHSDTKQEAIEKAKAIAKNQEAELKVQNKDGKISQSNSYGRDPFPPRG